jgi:hypothetical protein
MLNLDCNIKVIMARAKILVIKETEKEIKNLLKKFIPFISQLLRVLLILKKTKKQGFLDGSLLN